MDRERGNLNLTSGPRLANALFSSRRAPLELASAPPCQGVANTRGKPMEDREQRIREIAHRLWEEAGRPSGQADEHWEKARQIVDAEEAERAALRANAAG